MEEYKHIDLTKMNNLFKGQINFRQQVLSEYVDLLEEELQKIEYAIPQDDLLQIRKSAHKIRPTCSYMGMNRAHNLATNYMTVFDKDETPAGSDLLTLADALIEEVYRALQELNNEQLHLDRLARESYSRNLSIHQ